MIDPTALDLSLEQQFSMLQHEAAIDQMSPEDLRMTLKGATKLLMLRQNIINDLIRKTL